MLCVFFEFLAIATLNNVESPRYCPRHVALREINADIMVRLRGMTSILLTSFVWSSVSRRLWFLKTFFINMYKNPDIAQTNYVYT